jgi:type I restriction enzyme S subunit
MAITMIVKTSDLSNHNRSDPEYYLPNHTTIESYLEKVPTLPLGSLGDFCCSAFYPAATHLYNNDGRPFLRCVDIIEHPIISADQSFARIPVSFANKYSTIRHLKSGDIVISKVGTPCYASLLNEDIEIAAMTRTVLGMSNINTALVDPFYLVAFLRSKYGFDQLMRERELTIQYQLTLDRTRKVKVFIPEPKIQNEIGNMMRQYYKTIETSKVYYAQAQKLLETELGLENLRLERSLGYTTNYSNVFLNNRVDADYYQIPFIQIHKHLDKLNTVNLSSLVHIVKGIEVGSKLYVDEGKIFLRVSNITEKGIKLSSSDKYISKETFCSLAPIYQPKVGELILTKDGTAGTCLVVDEEIEGIISGGIVRLIRKSEDVPSEYLALVINSKACRMQVEQCCSGALILHWKLESIRKLRIPILPLSKMKAIAELVVCSKDKMHQSAKLLEQAKSRVEQLIEEGVK